MTARVRERSCDGRAEESAEIQVRCRGVGVAGDRVGRVRGGSRRQDRSAGVAVRPEAGPRCGRADRGADRERRQCGRRAIRTMVNTPQAVWFTGGTPQRVEQDVRQGTARRRADGHRARAGGLQRPGPRLRAVLRGRRRDRRRLPRLDRRLRRGRSERSRRSSCSSPTAWPCCRPTAASPDTFSRVGLIAVRGADALERRPERAVYLDAGHSAWHSVGDMAQRLVAGRRARTCRASS